MNKTISHRDFQLDVDDSDNVIALRTNTGRVANIGEKVRSNGRFNVPVGIEGYIVRLYKPFTGGQTDDVIEVMFPKPWGRQLMKFKDLV